jgi:hypothetical protein
MVIILGLLLALGAIGLSVAALWANQDTFEKPAGTFDLLGYTADFTIGQIFMIGIAIGALGLFGLVMLLNGAGRRASRRAATRRQLREQEQQLHDLQRKQDQAEAAAERETKHRRTAEERRELADR